MLEINCVYAKPEMTRMLGTKANGNIRKKLKRYGVDFTMDGDGEKATYTIHGMSFPFKVFAIVELGSMPTPTSSNYGTSFITSLKMKSLWLCLTR